MKYLFFISALLISLGLRAQTYNPYYASIVSSVEYDSVETYLTEFSSLGIKEIGTSALDDTRDWILDKYTSWGYTNIQRDSFLYSGYDAENIIITKTGSVYPNTYLIIDGHYDTRNGVGSNDNGSGTAIILEMARIFKDLETEYSVKFIHFSAEEDGLIGSQHYVDNTVVPENLDILLVYNIDEVGGVNGMTNNTIICERDEGPPASNNSASANVTDILANCIELYSSLSTEISYAYGSDYMPFEANGEIITGLYEKNVSPYVHTIFDEMSRLDMNYIYEIARGGLGAALEFAIPIQDFTSLDNISTLNYSVLPNPSNGMFELKADELQGKSVEVTISDVLGEVVFKMETFKYEKPIVIDLSEMPKGTYFLSLSAEADQTVTKIIIE